MLLTVNKYLRRIRQRQEHVGYFAICFFLWVLAVALGRRSGWLAVLALWAIFVLILELVYRSIISLGARNRRTWWAKPHAPGYWNVRFFGICICIALVALMIGSPLGRYGLLALLAAGLFCAGIIRLLHLKGRV